MNNTTKTSTKLPLTRSSIPIKAYSKIDLRVLLMNPNIDLKDEVAVSNAVRMHKKTWSQLMEKKLKGKLPESEWKHSMYLSETAVRLLLEPTFKIVEKGEEVGIKCLCCDRTSWNANDVQYKFCGHCNKFHEY